MDKTARAAQVAACIQQTGDSLTFTAPGQSPVVFLANIVDETPTVAEFDRQLGDNSLVRISAAASVFGNRLPRYGEYFTDTQGNIYRIQQANSHPLKPVVSFLCGSVATPEAIP